MSFHRHRSTRDKARRLVSLAVAGVVGVATFVACEDSSPVTPERVEGTSSVAVREGQDATVTSADRAVAVEVPGRSIAGSGTLSVAKASTSDGREGWSIELQGAELDGDARIVLADVELEDGEPAPIVTYSDGPDGPLKLAEDVDLTEAGVVVTTDHFSNWFVDSWNSATDWARRRLDRMYSGEAVGKQPRCEREADVRDAGYDITSDEGQRVMWCVGQDASGQMRLKVVNTRGYTVAVESAPGAVPLPGDRNDLVTTVASIIKDAPSRRGNTVTLLPPGDKLEFKVEGDTRTGVMVFPSVPGYLVTAAQYATETLDLVLDKSGAGRTPQQVRDLLKIETCLAGYSSMTTGTIANAAEAGTYLNEALSTTLGCAEDALQRADLGGPQLVLAQGITWLFSGIRTALNGFAAAADTALNPAGYQVRITPPAAPTTEVIALNPWRSGVLEDGWVIEDLEGDSGLAPIECGDYTLPAISGLSANTYSCGGTADNAHSCWAPDDLYDLVCLMNNPLEKGLVARSFDWLPETPPAENPIPSFIETDDGSMWYVRIGGAWSSPPAGWLPAYGCDSGPCTDLDMALVSQEGADPVNTSEDTWTVRVSELGEPDNDLPEPDTLAVSRAWFVTNE